MSLKYTWLPAATADSINPLKIHKAEGSYLISENGIKIFDAISSWWCKPLGHRHELVVNSIGRQLNYFEHHIPANTYNDTIEQLSTILIGIFDNMDKVMYASDGSCAVEIAMKLSYETRQLEGQVHKNKFIALIGAYHGETIFTLSVCGIDAYKKPYKKLLAKNYFIDSICYVTSKQDPLWSNCNFDENKFHALFAKIASKVTAMIVEPVAQGAAGMRIISKDFLIKLMNLARAYDIHIICDEIMVGLGRLACHSVSKKILNYEPDFVCFAKNLTAGSIPMSAVVINKTISDIFRQNNKIFAHSHTHSCNALAAKVAVKYLNYLSNSNLLNEVNEAEASLLLMVNRLVIKYSFIKNQRVIGAIMAFDLIIDKKLVDLIFCLAIKNGIYLRPINNTLYIMPPLYNILNELPYIEEKLNIILTNISLLLSKY